MMSDLSAAAPEASVVETLLDKYGSMLFDNVTEGESSQETLTAGDISQDCTVYEGQISAEDAVKLQLQSWKKQNQTVILRTSSIPGQRNSQVMRTCMKALPKL